MRPAARIGRKPIVRPIFPPVLQRLFLYQAKTRYYLLGYNGQETECRLLEFSRLHPFSVEPPKEDPKTYTPEEAQAYLQQLHKNGFADGGLHLMCEVLHVQGVTLRCP